MKKLLILLMIGTMLFTSCEKSNNIAGEWEVSGFPEFPFAETYIFHVNDAITLIRTNEDGIKYMEETGVYKVNGNKVKLNFENEDMGTIEYTFDISEDKLMLKDSSGDRMTYTKRMNY